MFRPQRPQLLGILLAALCVAGALSLAGVGSAGAAESPKDNLNVTVTTSEDSVWVNETVDVTVTIESTGDQRYDVNDITLVDEDGETVAEEKPFGVTVNSGESETFRLSDVKIDEPGAIDLQATVSVEYRLKQSDITVDESVTITATDPEPVVDLTAERAVGGSERTLSLTVGNPHNGPLNRVSASLRTPDGTDVRLVDATGATASIAPSETHDIEFVARGGSTGTQEFVLSMAFETPDGEYWEITRSVTAEFLEPTGLRAPVVDLTEKRVVGGAERTLSLSVGNPNNVSLSRVDASLSTPDGADFTLVDAGGTITAIDPSETRTLEFTAQGGSAGTKELTLSLGFELSDGNYREITRQVAVEFREPSETAAVDIAEASVSATPNGVRINGSLFTAGNLSVRDVRITAADAEGVEPARPDPQSYISSLSGEGTGSFELTTALADDRERIPLSVQYRTDGVQRTTTVEVPYSGPRSVPPVQLSSVDVSGSGTVSITGEVANTRGNPVAGVTVSVVDAEGVSPGPSGEFFAGSIESGQFTPLERITAEVTGNRNSIPIELTYSFQGTQYSTVVEVDYDNPNAPTGGGSDGGSAGSGGQADDTSLPEFDPGSGGDSGGGSDLGGLPVLVGGVLVVASLLIGAVVYRRR